MDPSLKELAKLERLANSGSSKGKSPAVESSLDALLQSLRETKERTQSGNASTDTFSMLQKKVESTKKDVDERQKEVYNSLARFGKALDKVRSFHSSHRDGAPEKCALPAAVSSAVAIVSAHVQLAGGRRRHRTHDSRTLSQDRSV